jgi:hypothetical protein
LHTFASEARTARRTPTAQAATRARLPVGASHQVRSGAANLTVGPTGDSLEREADAVADHVMRMPAAGAQAAQTRADAPPSVRAKSDSTGRAATPTGPAAAPPVVHDVLNSPGQPLDAATRSYFEPRFGRDFSDVRIHHGAQAASAAAGVQARAFTVGRNVVFGAGEHNPASERGKRLLAHELTHVVQQSDGAGSRDAGGTGASLQRLPGPAATPASAGPGTPSAGAVRGSPPTTLTEWIICLAICACDLAPMPSKSGAELRQACVSALLLGLDLASDWKSPIKAEVSYDMKHAGGPDPIMDPAKPTRPRSPWGAFWEMIKRYGAYTGGLRRPDVVTVNNPAAPPEQKNINRVIEIKFPGDTLTDVQRAAYEKIAGSPAKFAVFTPTSCGCDEIEDSLHKLVLILELVGIAVLMVAIVADDLAGQVEDDPALIPLGARIAAIISELTSTAPILLKATVQ